MSKSKATDYFESEDVDHNNQTSQTPARSASIDQPSTNSANTRPYGELRDIMGPNTNATPTRDHLNGMITATPGGTLHGTVGQEIRVEALLNSARHLQANFRERKITTLDQLIAHLPDMYAQMSCLGRVPALISGRLPQNEATQTEINIAAGLIQSMCSDVEAVTSYLYKWRVLHEDFNIPEMFEALQNGLCGYDRDIGVKALDDVKALRYKGGPISTLLSEMDRLFRIIETRSKKKSQLTDEDKLDILQRKFVGQMLFHPVTCKTHRDYRALCLSLLEYETDLRNAGCLPCKSTTSDTTVEQAYVADSSTRSNRQAFFDGYCRKCNKRGHKERNCPENEELNKQSLSSIQCLICKKFGHPSDECLNKLYATISYLKDNQVKKVRSEKRHYQAKPSDQPAEPYRKKRYANVAETVETLDESSTETASEGETDSNLITDSLYVSHTNSLINHPNAPIDLLDSGANSSHVNNETRFDALHKTPKFFIQTADGKLAESSGRKGKIGHIPNVNYTPQFPHNLVSVSKLVELGYQIKFNMDGAIITDSRTKKLCGTGLQRDGLYFINLQSILPSQLLIEKNEQPSTRGLVLLANNISQDSWTKWHFRLHLPKSSIKKLVESQAVQGLDVKLSDLKKEHLNCLSCAQCQTDKQPKELGYPYGKPEPVIGGQIVTDIWTMGEDGVGGITYCIGFLDVHSGFAHIYFMKKKSEATNMLLKLIAKYSLLIPEVMPSGYACFQQYINKIPPRHKISAYILTIILDMLRNHPLNYYIWIGTWPSTLVLDLRHRIQSLPTTMTFSTLTIVRGCRILGDAAKRLITNSRILISYSTHPNRTIQVPSLTSRKRAIDLCVTSAQPTIKKYFHPTSPPSDTTSPSYTGIYWTDPDVYLPPSVHPSIKPLHDIDAVPSSSNVASSVHSADDDNDNSCNFAHTQLPHSSSPPLPPSSRSAESSRITSSNKSQPTILDFFLPISSSTTLTLSHTSLPVPLSDSIRPTRKRARSPPCPPISSTASVSPGEIQSDHLPLQDSARLVRGRLT